MKIKITDATKAAFFMSEMSQIEALQAAMDEQKDFKWEADRAVQLVSGLNGIPVMSYTAEAAKNTHMSYDRHGEGTGYADVWLWIKAFDPYFGFWYIGCYVSDIWDILNDGSNEDIIRSRFYSRHYTLKDD